MRRFRFFITWVLVPLIACCANGGMLGFHHKTSDKSIPAKDRFSMIYDSPSWSKVHKQPVLEQGYRLYPRNSLSRSVQFVNSASKPRNKILEEKPPILTSQPHPQRVVPGSPATYQVKVEAASKPVSFQWQFRPPKGTWTVIKNDGKHIRVRHSSSGSQLEVLKVTDSDVGEYRCHIFHPSHPEKGIYCRSAYLSVLRITLHPRDVFTPTPSTYSVGASAGGLPLTYRWLGQSKRAKQDAQVLNLDADHQELFSGIDTPTMIHWEKNTGLNYFVCEVSDGYATVKSLPAGHQNTPNGQVAGDSFWHGNGWPQALRGTPLPFGGIPWQAHPDLVHYAGQAYLRQGGANRGAAFVTWFPQDQTIHLVAIEMAFPKNSTGEDHVDFGFFHQGYIELWVRQYGDCGYEVYAGTDTLLASGQSTQPSGTIYILGINTLKHTLTLSNGGEPWIKNLPLPNNFSTQFTGAGFQLKRISANLEIGVTRFRLLSIPR